MAAMNGFPRLLPAYAGSPAGPGKELRVGGDRIADLVIARTPFEYGDQRGSAITINGSLPGPTLRFREGETVTLRVTNRLEDPTSIHWHGILVPSDMDGVPGLSFPGIQPGETFTYRYPVRQSGTFWYHSHSMLQEQSGLYAPLLIDPAGSDPIEYDREYVVLLSDWTFEDPQRVLAKLKKQSDYYNFQKRTVADFINDARMHGLAAAWKDRKDWEQMRMDPTDIHDVTGYTYTYLLNGLPPDLNWTALFRPGERVRLRFINSAASSYFNVRIPGLPLTVVQADGQNVQPVTVDEFQIAVAETFDVVVEPKEDKAYTLFAESMDRSGYTRGTLAPREGMQAPVPPIRKRPLRSMVDMGMDMSKMDMPGMNTSATGAKTDMPGMKMDRSDMKSNQMPGMKHDQMSGANVGVQDMPMPGMRHDTEKAEMPGMAAMPDMGEMSPMTGMDSPVVARHGPDDHGPGNAMTAMVERNRLGEPGTGLDKVGHRVLVYNDLKSLEPSRFANVPVTRDIEMHLTGNMERFIWGIDGKKFSEAEPFRVRTGERVRVTLVNDTMMEHPMHLHGVFMELDNGSGAHKPRKHTINVRPAERLSFEFVYDEPGNFFFHCHFQFHMEAGMARFFNVSGAPLRANT